MSDPANPNDTYTSPLASRNASPEMLTIWSPRTKFNTWRQIWLAFAQAQQACNLDITDDQIAELESVVNQGISDSELIRATELERDLRHDVMAHVHCLGEQCPKAKPIIHLGMTSQDVVCNADLLCLDAALELTITKLARLVLALGEQAHQHREVPTLGFTHYQAAQPTTVGRRLAGWAHDVEILLFRLRLLRDKGFIRLRGPRGATGTQASFLSLFDGDSQKVDQLEALFIKKLTSSQGSGIHADTYTLTGQTYPRVVDALVLADLASVGAVLHKIATDIRLLSNRKELDEPFGKNQIGSSAMPYKRNPMKCERICGLSRFVMNLAPNAYDTAATQWLERTLDDSSNRRLSLPQAFLALDGALDLAYTVASGLVVNQAMVRRNLLAELPFLATENILMEAVKAGGDRQDLHEKIRIHAQISGHRVKQEGLDNDLLDRLQADALFHTPALNHELDWQGLMDPMQYVGRAVQQTDQFVQEVLGPLREKYTPDLEKLSSSDRGV